MAEKLNFAFYFAVESKIYFGGILIWRIPDLNRETAKILSHFIYSWCNACNQVPFYLWRIGPALKHKVPKYYDQDCRSKFKKDKLTYSKLQYRPTCYFTIELLPSKRLSLSLIFWNSFNKEIWTRSPKIS